MNFHVLCIFNASFVLAQRFRKSSRKKCRTRDNNGEGEKRELKRVFLPSPLSHVRANTT